MQRGWNEDNPGPGAYRANYGQVLRSPPKHTFGLNTAIWFDYGKPGPGTYNLRKDDNTSPKYTMADRYNGPSGTDVRGPGRYHASLKHTNMRAPAYTMQGPTMYNPDRGVPGPGTYDLREEIGGPAFTLAQKFSPKVSTTPGPGTYSPNSPASAPAYSMGQHLFESRSNMPGPGAYNLRSNEFSGPMFSMAKRFYRLRDRKKERRYSVALWQRPHSRPHSRPHTSSRGASRQMSARNNMISQPSSVASPPATPRDLNSRPSTWDISQPKSPLSRPITRPRPMTSAQHIARRQAYMRGPTQNAQYNEYIRDIQRYTALKGLAHGHVA